VVMDPPTPAVPAFSFEIPKIEDLVVCEAHVRDLTAHPSAGIDDELRGRFVGLQSDGLPLRHLRRMGYNCIELLPIHEFDDEPPGQYHWGYMTSLFFAPDAAYGTTPLGAATNEFAALVARLHKLGFAVVMDVVFNHTGAPHHLARLDRAYYYRRGDDGGWANVSGCGNDLRSESHMARRLVVDACRFWLERYGVDGFRFDLAHLIDGGTLDAIAAMADEVRPGAILIAEPWSFGGDNKAALGATGVWSCWNDDFRNRVKSFVLGHLAHRDELVEVLSGSTALWASSPGASVNYVESHDDYTLVDHLSHRKDRDGSHPTVREIRQNRMCALMLLTAPGIPMLAQGQELLRSKGGCGNSYDRGDAVNAVRWDRRTACTANVEYVRALVALRRSTAGAPFRRAAAVPGHRYKVVLPDESGAACPKAVGVRIPGPPDWVLLLNAHQRKAVAFELPRGRWRQVADLETVTVDGGAGPTVHGRLVLRPLDGRLLVRVDTME